MLPGQQTLPGSRGFFSQGFPCRLRSLRYLIQTTAKVRKYYVGWWHGREQHTVDHGRRLATVNQVQDVVVFDLELCLWSRQKLIWLETVCVSSLPVNHFQSELKVSSKGSQYYPREFQLWLSLREFNKKTRATISGRSTAVWPPRSWLWISRQAGLQVKVRKRSGLPYYLHRAIASWYNCVICRGLPWKEDGRIKRVPMFWAVAVGSVCRASCNPL